MFGLGQNFTFCIGQDQYDLLCQLQLQRASIKHYPEPLSSLCATATVNECEGIRAENLSRAVLCSYIIMSGSGSGSATPSFADVQSVFKRLVLLNLAMDARSGSGLHFKCARLNSLDYFFLPTERIDLRAQTLSGALLMLASLRGL